MDEDDKVNIWLTMENDKVVDQLMDTKLFQHKLDVAKLAMAYAMKSGIKPFDLEIKGGAGTKWNVGSVDQGGEIRSFVLEAYPGAENPYKLVQFFMNRGVALLGEIFEQNKSNALFMLIGLLEDAEKESKSMIKRA
jgi:hypothetical protein